MKQKRQVTNNRIKDKRRKRNQGMNFFERFTVFVVLIIIGYISYVAYRETNVITPTEVFVMSGAIENVITGKAKIIRNEVVLYSDKDGDVEYYYHEGEKVKNGSILCKIYEKQLSEDIDSKLDELDLMIERNKTNLSQTAQDEIENVNEYIYSLIDEYLIYSKTDYEFDVYELKQELTSKFAIKRNVYLKNGTTETNKYISERDNYTNILDGSTKNVYAPMGGIISYYVDGFEENYTPSNIQNLKGKYLQIESSKMITGNKKSEIKSLEAICKVVDNSFWYITAIFDKDETKDWTNNLKKTLRVKNVSDGILKGTIVNVLEYGNANIVTFQINEQINKYMAFRDIEIEVIEKNVSGLKISNSAIATKKTVAIPKSYVTSKQSKDYAIKKGETGDKKTVSLDIVSSDNEYYYVLVDDIINVGDTIYNPETSVPMLLSLEKEVKGAYKLIGTEYDFVPINILTQNETSTIIEEKVGSGIQIYDKVILDSEMMK